MGGYYALLDFDGYGGYVHWMCRVGVEYGIFAVVVGGVVMCLGCWAVWWLWDVCLACWRRLAARLLG